MATGRLEIGARLKGGSEAKAYLGGRNEALSRAAYDATRESTEVLADMAAQAIRSITGSGVYWDIEQNVESRPNGAVGRVSTPPSRPHTIRPIPPNTRLLFRIPGVGWRSPRLVNHPGSKPVDWPDRVGGFDGRAERIFERHVGQALEGR